MTWTFDPERIIRETQQWMIDAAIAYDAGFPIADDRIYDMTTRYLQRMQAEYPEVWDKVDHPLFRDGSWQYTGMFIYPAAGPGEE